VGFTGFGEDAVEFYDGLLADNSKAYWSDRKAVYEGQIREPMQALLTALEPEFGAGKIFRPYRDVRFAKDKTPFKTAQGAYVEASPSVGWYVQVSAPGVRVGAGWFDAGSDRLARIREAIADDRTGPRLVRLVRRLERAGFEVGGERLKTSPRGYAADHPRIELLRHKHLTLGRSYGFEPVIHSPDLLDRVREDWAAMAPLVRWAGAAAAE